MNKATIATIRGGYYTNNKRVIGLDLLRISLALLIFMFHSRCHVLKCDYGVLNGFVTMGAIAMTGFFLLSGYVINLSTRRNDLTSPKEIGKFYAKRLIAILPLYYAYALVNIAINVIQNGSSAAAEELMLFPIETLCIQSVFASLFNFSHNGGSWFISCIMICYFVFPLFDILTNKLSDKTRTLIIIVLIAILLWSPFVENFFNCQSIYSNPFFRTLEFAIGMLVSQMNIKHETDNRLIVFLRKPWVCLSSAIILILGVSMAYYLGIPGHFMLYSWVALPCFISLLFSLGYIRFVKMQNSKTIHYLSALSFAFFLSQLLVVWNTVATLTDKLGLYGDTANIFNIILSFILCFGIANAFYFLVERPSTKYLNAKLSEKTTDKNEQYTISVS